LKRAAGEGRGAVGNLLLVDVVERSGAVGIEQCGFGGDVDRCAQSGDAEFHEEVGGKRGIDFDDAVVRGEAFAVNLKAIASEEEITDGELAGIVGGEGAVELKGVAGEVGGGFDREAVRPDDVQAEFSGVALGESCEREQQDDGTVADNVFHV